MNAPRIRPLVRLVAFSQRRVHIPRHVQGVAILIVLFALELAALWQLLPW